MRNGWLPMITAPTDGSRVLLLYERGLPMSTDLATVTVGRYVAESTCLRPRPFWQCDREQLWGRSWLRANPPVAWQPLPDAET